MTRGGPLVVAAMSAACFAPEAREGLPCSESGHCPPGQACQAGVCAGGAVIDGGETPDATLFDAAPPDPPGAFGTVEPVVLTCPGPMVCVNVRDPFLNADRTAILFTYLVNAVNGNFDIYVASRVDSESGFMQATSAGTINTTLEEHTPFLSGDGTQLWFARRDISSGAAVRPYDEVLLSVRVGGPFDMAAPVAGGVNTLLGNERSPQVTGDGQIMLFARSGEPTPADHDVYLARQEGGQWNTIELVRELSAPGGNERSLALVEPRKALFFIRDDQIHEVLWTGEDPTAVAVEVVHAELDANPPDSKVGLWASQDGTEIWFDSDRAGAPQIYRAVRAIPTL
jgi:hypothetical protein